MRRTLYVLVLLIFVVIASCKKDDGEDVTVIPPRTLAEVALEDEAAIQAFLESHFYNYEEFASPPADFDYKIRIDTLAGENAGKTPLSQQVVPKTVSVSSSEFALSAEETTNHTLYTLVAREGVGASPSVADSAFVRYRGTLLDGSEFDGSFYSPLWFDLATIQGPLQGARGFSEGMPSLKAGGNVIENPDGTFTVEDYGVGLIIMPSGLGFFNSGRSAIPAYSPLIFEIDLYTINPTDHDGDGVPSIIEDVDGDGYLYNDNTDLEQERASGGLARFVNFLDRDDDQDNTPTREEIIIDEEGNVSYPDTDGDGIPDYLDRDNP